MPDPGRSIINQLEEEWRLLRDSPELASALRRWARTRPALRHDSPQALIDHVHAAAPADADQALAALAAHAGDDRLAARTLLQALLPGCKTLVHRYGYLNVQDRAAVIVGAAYERIRAYPLQRRPARIAANILADTRKELVRVGATGVRRAPERPEAADRPPQDSALEAAEARAVLATLRRQHSLSGDAAELLWLTRGLQIPIAELAGGDPRCAARLRQQRRRVETHLRQQLTL